MYQILFGCVREYSSIHFDEWYLLYDGFLTIEEACQKLTEEIRSDISNDDNVYAYRIVEVKP